MVEPEAGVEEATPLLLPKEGVGARFLLATSLACPRKEYKDEYNKINEIEYNIFENNVPTLPFGGSRFVLRLEARPISDS